MKRHFFSLLVVFLTTVFITGCGYSGYVGPEKAVRNELELIQKMDEDTICTVLSAEGLNLSDNKDFFEAVRLFFKDFTYDIVSSQQGKDGTTASVKVNITNIDANILAKDLCRKMIKQTCYYGSTSSDNYDLLSYFSLIKECLSEKTYPTKKTEVTFQLSFDNDVWTIVPTAALSDELVGGLVHFLSDSYLLSPDEVLDLELDQFRSFDANDWINYLNINNIFSLDTSEYSDIDQLLASKLASFFDYRILDTKQDGDTAQVKVRITGIDLNSVIETTQSDLLSYAQTLESVRASDEELMQKATEILKKALEESGSPSEIDTTIVMNHSDSFWEAVLEDGFTNALLGNPEVASTVLSNTSS